MAGVCGLSDLDVRRLVAQAVPRGADEPFGAYLFRTDEPGADLGRCLERDVFFETFGDTPELLAAEYGPYERSSFFLCVIDHKRELPAGVMRVLLPSPRGFKSLNDIGPVWGEPAGALMERTGLGIDLTRTWDIATLVIADGYRRRAARGLVSMGLYQTLTLAAHHCGVEWFVAILDMPVFRMLRWKLRMIFAGFDGLSPRQYLGSAASIPAWCNVPEAARRLAEQDPDLYAVLVEGKGLEPALRKLDLAQADGLVAWRREEAAGL